MKRNNSSLLSIEKKKPYHQGFSNISSSFTLHAGTQPQQYSQRCIAEGVSDFCAGCSEMLLTTHVDAARQEDTARQTDTVRQMDGAFEIWQDHADILS